MKLAFASHRLPGWFWLVGLFLLAWLCFWMHMPRHPYIGSDTTLLAIQAQGCVDHGWCYTDNVHLSWAGPPHGALWHYYLETIQLLGIQEDGALRLIGLLGALCVTLLAASLASLTGRRWAFLAGLVWIGFWPANATLWNPSLLPWTATLVLATGLAALRTGRLGWVLASGVAAGMATQTHLLMAVYALAGAPLLALGLGRFNNHEATRHPPALPVPVQVYALWSLGFVVALLVWAPSMLTALLELEGASAWLPLVAGGAIVAVALGHLVVWLLLVGFPRLITPQNIAAGLALSAAFAGWVIQSASPAQAAYNDYYYQPAWLGLKVGAMILAKPLAKRLVPDKWAKTALNAVTCCLALLLLANGAVDQVFRQSHAELTWPEGRKWVDRLSDSETPSLRQMREHVATGPELPSFWWHAVRAWPMPTIRPEPPAQPATLDSRERDVGPLMSAGTAAQNGEVIRLILAPGSVQAEHGWSTLPREDETYSLLVRTEPELLDRSGSWTCLSDPDSDECQCRPFHNATCELADSVNLWPLRWMCFYRQRVFQSASAGDMDLFAIWSVQNPPVAPQSEASQAATSAASLAANPLANQAAEPAANPAARGAVHTWLVPPLDLQSRCPGFALPGDGMTSPGGKAWSVFEQVDEATRPAEFVAWYPIRNEFCAQKLITAQQDVPMPLADGPASFVAPLFSMDPAGRGAADVAPEPTQLPQACRQAMAQWQEDPALEDDYDSLRAVKTRVASWYVLPAAVLAMLFLVGLTGWALYRAAYARKR